MDSFFKHRNKSLRFDEESHTYHVQLDCGIWVECISVTKLVSTFQEPFKRDMMASICARKESKELGIELTSDDLKYKWNYNADFGTIVHMAAESISKGHGFDEELDEREPPYRDALIRFFDTFPEGTKFLSETMIFDKDLLISGTIDLLVLLPDGTIEIADFKTNEEIKYEAYQNKTFYAPVQNLPSSDFYKYSLQVALYTKMLNKMGINISKRYLVHLNPSVYADSGYKIIYTKWLNEEAKELMMYRSRFLNGISLQMPKMIAGMVEVDDNSKLHTSEKSKFNDTTLF